MLLTSIFVAAALTVSAHATPPMPTPTQSSREPYTPTIGPGFTPQEVEQLQDAFRDAMTLASYAAQPNTSLDTVFNDYFNITDRQLVTGEYSMPRAYDAAH